MAIAPAFRSTAVQAILGPARSGLVPSTLYVGWLDSSGDLIAMSGTTVSHDDFGPADNGVQNSVPLDCGVAGSGWNIHAVALFADAAGGALLMWAELDAPLTPDASAPLGFDIGDLRFTIGDEGEPSA